MSVEYCVWLLLQMYSFQLMDLLRGKVSSCESWLENLLSLQLNLLELIVNLVLQVIILEFQMPRTMR